MDGEKERRNLLVISTAIILFFWLELPEGLIAERVLGQKIEGKINSWKVWAAIVALMMYQIHRFYSVAKGSELCVGAVNLFRTWRRDVVQFYLHEEIAALEKGDIKRPKILCGEFANNKLKDIDEECVNWRKMIFKTGSATIFNEQNWTGTAYMNYPTKRTTYSGTEEFCFPKSKRLMVDLKLVHRFIGTKYLSEYGVPIIWAYSALWLSVYRLTGELL